jgi:hypothetical protein
MTELAMALQTGEYRGKDILTNPTAQEEATWVLDEVLFKGDNHEVLKYNDEGFNPKWQYVKLVPANLDDETQDRWLEFVEKSITHFKAVGIPTNQYGNTAEDGDDYEQTLAKLEIKLDPSKAKSNNTQSAAYSSLQEDVAELKNTMKNLLQVMAARESETANQLE